MRKEIPRQTRKNPGNYPNIPRRKPPVILLGFNGTRVAFSDDAREGSMTHSASTLVHDDIKQNAFVTMVAVGVASPRIGVISTIAHASRHSGGRALTGSVLSLN